MEEKVNASERDRNVTRFIDCYECSENRKPTCMFNVDIQVEVICFLVSVK